jgi:hypothetical protein
MVQLRSVQNAAALLAALPIRLPWVLATLERLNHLQHVDDCGLLGT